MKKYAMVWTTDIGYMPGTNASLNGLYHYGFNMDEIDVYILFWENLNKLPTGYREQWPDSINFELLDTSFCPGKTAYWYLVFSQFQFALTRLKDYEVVLFWGGDLCIVNNFEIYFEIAEKTNRIVLGTNEQGIESFERMTPEWPYKHTWSVPYADVPLFVPRERMDVIKTTLEYQYRDGAEVDMMDGLNYAIRDLNAPVYALPGCFWVMNVPQWVEVKRTDDKLHCHQHRMNSFHRKYWNEDFAKRYIRELQEPAWKNVKTFNYMYNFLNTECQVKWTQGLEKFYDK